MNNPPETNLLDPQSPFEGWRRWDQEHAKIIEALKERVGARLAAAFMTPFMAIGDAADSLQRFENTGHGMFLWRAYMAARSAKAALPEYFGAIGEEANETHKILLATIDEQLTPEWIAAFTERVLKHLDDVAGDLVKVRDTATSTGVKKLRAALRLKLDVRRANALLKNEYIIAEFKHQYFELFRNLNDSTQRSAILSRRQLYSSVGNAVGMSRVHVASVIAKYLRANADEPVRDDEIKDGEFTLVLDLNAASSAKVRAKIEKVRPNKRRKRPAARHAWRR